MRCFISSTEEFPVKINKQKIALAFSAPGGMKTSNFVPQQSDLKSRRHLVRLVTMTSLIFGLYFLGNSILQNNFRIPQRSQLELKDMGNTTTYGKFKNRCGTSGNGALPKGIIVKTSDMDMRPLWGSVDDNNQSKRSMSLLAISAGIKQKHLVNKIIAKFIKNGFVVMMFHYDGNVDQWNDLGWARRVIHISAMHQTKWWFAKRFLHPDIVAEYDYIFLWDEDLGVEHFDPTRYLSIIKEEGLDISQPALDPAKSQIHHEITMRMRNSKVHRNYIKLKGGKRCYAASTGPPCTGWVEMMAPVFSKAAWKCAWNLIQNDLIHGWGIDYQLGYCAQGDRMKKVGVVDAEYVVHLGVPSLGGSKSNKQKNSDLDASDARSKVRRQSLKEMNIFSSRWKQAVKDDECWVDPYKTKNNIKKSFSDI